MASDEEDEEDAEEKLEEQTLGFSISNMQE